MSLGTPQAVSSTLLKCWTIAPTSERIIEDISAFPRVLGKIVAAEGCVVKDEFLRTGRRARRADGNGLLKNKPRASQRKATLKAAPLHPDCQAAYDAFVKGAQFDVVSSDAESSSEEEEEEGGGDETPVSRRACVVAWNTAAAPGSWVRLRALSCLRV